MNTDNSNRKEDIIIQLGAEWIRVGLVGDKAPRKTFRSKSLMKISQEKSFQMEMQIEEFLCNVFFTFLNSTCQGKTVIILEKVYTDRRLLQYMATIMFKKLKIQKLQLSLSCVTPLYLSGKYTGVVISSGASCTQIMPVYQGFPIFRSYTYVHGGTLQLNKQIRDELALMNPQVPIQTLRQISEEQISDIKQNHGSIPSNTETVIIPIKRNKLKFNPSKINFNVLFGDYANQEPNIAYSFLNMLENVPIDCLKQLCKNIIFSGGMWRIKGMQKYFKQSVSQLLPKFKRLTNMNIRQELSFVSWGFNPSDIAWIGCSIGASVRNIQNLCLKRSQFQQKGHYIQKIMETYFLSN